MGKLMSLVGEKVYLNPLQEGDLSTLSEYMNDEHVKLFGRNCGSAVYEKKMKEHLNDQLENEMYTIFRKDNNEIIGDISIHSIDKYNRAGSLSIMICKEENQNKGFGSEAMLLILKHAFLEINLESLQLGTWEYNLPAIKVYKKIGFKIAGRNRNRKIVGNKFYDEILMDMISEDYFNLYGNAEFKKYNLNELE